HPQHSSCPPVRTVMGEEPLAIIWRLTPPLSPSYRSSKIGSHHALDQVSPARARTWHNGGRIAGAPGEPDHGRGRRGGVRTKPSRAMSHCNSAKLFAPTACPSGVCFQTSAKRRLNPQLIAVGLRFTASSV